MSKKDSEVLAAIRSGRDQQALSALYSDILPKVTRYICSNSGDHDEAYDIFQDSVLIFYKQVKMDKFDDRYDIAGFVFTICRNLWINRAKRKKRSVDWENHSYDHGHSDTAETDLISKEKEAKVMELLSQLGEKCKNLLVNSIFHKLPLKEIKDMMGFVSENAVKTQKYKCKQKLLALVGEKEDFIKKIEN